MYDNFFELGGNSFLAIQIINRLKVAKYQLSLRDLFFYQTIAELSKKIEGITEEPIAKSKNLNGSFKEYDNIIPLQRDGDLPPIFMVDSYWVYIKLAFYLGKNQPFYTLEEGKHDKIAEQAAFYITKIKLIQPTGPYYLGGFCRFGFVALEMARQLKAAGEEVGTVFLFETYAPAGIIPRLSWTYMRRSFDRLINFPSLNRRRYIKDEIRQAAKSLLLATVKLVMKRRLIKTSSGKFVLGRPSPFNFKYSGKVVLVKAGSPDPWAKDDAEMGWSHFIDGEIQAYIVEGSHTDIFATPGVIQLAKIMKRILETSTNSTVNQLQTH